jgi:NADH-quinone oxidoreductase subunit C
MGGKVMIMEIEEIRSQIQKKFPDAILETSTCQEMPTLRVRAEDILSLCRFLRDTPALAFNYLVDLCGVDHYPQEPRFEVVVHLRSMKSKAMLRLKVSLPGDDPHVASVTAVWKGADWLEREAFDMFGIRFDGHPDLRRILLTPDWQGHPLRKDYPLRG